MLRKRQIEVAQQLYEGRLTEDEILEQFKLSRKILRKWLATEEFQKELEDLHERSRREAQFAIARYAPVAALRLAELVGSEKADIARRAATDLVDRCLKLNVPVDSAESREEDCSDITDEQARQMLLTLAKGMNR